MFRDHAPDTDLEYQQPGDSGDAPRGNRIGDVTDTFAATIASAAPNCMRR